MTCSQSEHRILADVECNDIKEEWIILSLCHNWTNPIVAGALSSVMDAGF